MSRIKRNPDMPSGLKQAQRVQWLKDRNLCTYCGKKPIDKDSSKVYCYECLVYRRNLNRAKHGRDKIYYPSKKEDSLLKCAISADELGVSYGQYMLMKGSNK
jgi:hypothetical protein